MINVSLRLLELTKNLHVHNFSYHIFDCYLYLNDLLKKRNIRFIDKETLELISRGKKKLFYYGNEEKDFSNFQNEGIIYSIKKLKMKNERKFKEIEYDFDIIFDLKSYKNSKKRYQRITYPFQKLKKYNITFSSIDKVNIHKYENLHKIWVNQKLKDEKVFRIMFPQKRYINCINCAINSYDKYIGIEIKMEDKIIALRIIGYNINIGYDLAFFGLFWELPSQMMNYINIGCMKYLQEKKIRYLNCGYAMNKYLEMYKTHYPYREIVSYIYSKNNQSKIKEEDRNVFF